MRIDVSEARLGLSCRQNLEERENKIGLILEKKLGVENKLVSFQNEIFV